MCQPHAVSRTIAQNDLITAAVDLKGRDAENWREPLANFTDRQRPNCHTCNTSQLHLASAYENHWESIRRHTGFVKMENQWSQTFIIGKKQRQGVVLLLPRVGAGRWLAESKESTPLMYQNELLECHIYLLQWAFYVGFSAAERIGQVQRRQEMQTLPIFFTPRYEILSGVFNDSSVHLSRNRTALKIQGRGWNADKWRAGRI